jgi:hypothetical protein
MGAHDPPVAEGFSFPNGVAAQQHDGRLKALRYVSTLRF